MACTILYMFEFTFQNYVIYAVIRWTVTKACCVHLIQTTLNPHMAIEIKTNHKCAYAMATKDIRKMLKITTAMVSCFFVCLFICLCVSVCYRPLLRNSFILFCFVSFASVHKRTIANHLSSIYLVSFFFSFGRMQ